MKKTKILYFYFEDDFWLYASNNLDKIISVNIIDKTITICEWQRLHD